MQANHTAVSPKVNEELPVKSVDAAEPSLQLVNVEEARLDSLLLAMDKIFATTE